MRNKPNTLPAMYINIVYIIKKYNKTNIFLKSHVSRNDSDESYIPQMQWMVLQC